MVDAYVHYCEVLFDRFKGKVKYWLTFNEINMLLHLSFTGAGWYSTPARMWSRSSIRPPITSWWPAQRR